MINSYLLAFLIAGYFAGCVVSVWAFRWHAFKHAGPSSDATAREYLISVGLIFSVAWPFMLAAAAIYGPFLYLVGRPAIWIAGKLAKGPK